MENKRLKNLNLNLLKKMTIRDEDSILFEVEKRHLQLTSKDDREDTMKIGITWHWNMVELNIEVSVELGVDLTLNRSLSWTKLNCQVSIWALIGIRC